MSSRRRLDGDRRAVGSESTGASRPRRRARAPTAPRPPSVVDLVHGPELAALWLLEVALGAAADALVAEHMTLIDDLCSPREQGPVVCLADAICRRAASLRDLLGRYRRAVHEAAVRADAKSSDDDLF